MKTTIMAQSLASWISTILLFLTIASANPLPQLPSHGTLYSAPLGIRPTPTPEPARIIPSLPNPASITIFVFLGLLGLLVPILLLLNFRRKRAQQKSSPLANSNTSNPLSRPNSRLTFMTRSRGNSNATYTTYSTFKSTRLSTLSMDSFCDEVKRPERVLSFKRPWERDKEMDLYIVEDEDGPRRKPTIRSSTRYPIADTWTGAGIDGMIVQDYTPANWPLRN